MKNDTQSFFWFWIINKPLFALAAVFLLALPNGFGTTLVVLVSGSSIVFGADSKGIDAWAYNMKPVRRGAERKVFVLKDRFLVSTSGTARIRRAGSDGSTRIIYDAEAWLNSLPIKGTPRIKTVAEIISSSCFKIFKSEWDFLLTSGPVSIPNLSNNPNLPWVHYYIGGNGPLGPEVYSIAIYIDWTTYRLRVPAITRIHPPLKGVTQRRNTFVTYQSINGGGIDQLLSMGSETQRKYLRLYDKEVGGAVYDEPLDMDSLAKLARIMLTLEIETTPDRYSFPITVGSVVPGQRPICNSYDR